MYVCALLCCVHVFICCVFLQALQFKLLVLGHYEVVSGDGVVKTVKVANSMGDAEHIWDWNAEKKAYDIVRSKLKVTEPALLDSLIAAGWWYTEFMHDNTTVKDAR